jgi:LacI family transcriptional regulator
MKKPSSTIRDVAKLAKVSVATVSRILNDLPGYSEETKATVVKAIEQLGYTPNALARGLVNRKTRTLGMLLPSVSSKFASELLRGIENAAHAASHSVIVCNTNVDGQRTLEYLRVLSEKRVDGIIFTSEYVKEEYGELLLKMRVPVVLVSTATDRFPFPHIRVDDRQAAYMATRYLVDKGHTRIGMIAGTRTDQVAGAPRLEGFRQAMTDARLGFSSDLVAHGDFAYQSGIRCMGELLERNPGLTAVFAASDEMAVGALSYAYKHGVRVPDDVSVVGYDDTLDAVMSIPPLTTVHQPIAEMGEKAVQMLLSRSEDSVIMPFHITERSSVRPM